MSTPAAATGRDSPKLPDDTICFLCGAVHLADSAIREYLVEATRSIPRSPGVPLFAGSGMLLAALASGTRPPLGKRPQQASSHVRAPLVPDTVAGVIALVFALCKFINELYANDRYSRSCYEEYEPSSGGDATAAAIIAIAVISSNVATAGQARTGTTRVSTAKESR